NRQAQHNFARSLAGFARLPWLSKSRANSNPRKDGRCTRHSTRMEFSSSHILLFLLNKIPAPGKGLEPRGSQAEFAQIVSNPVRWACENQRIVQDASGRKGPSRGIMPNLLHFSGGWSEDNYMRIDEGLPAPYNSAVLLL